jgi:hypothetical protein
MTFEELGHDLPNGLHDSKLERSTLDYLKGNATLQIAILVGTPDSEDPQKYRPAILQITGLCFCAIELPSPNEPFIPDGSAVIISGYLEESQPHEKPNESIKKISELLAKCPRATCCYRFFSHDWNSFIHYRRQGRRAYLARKCLGSTAC